MKKRWFFIVVLCIVYIASAQTSKHHVPRSFYQLTIYHFSSSNQENALDAYLSKALVPGLHRQNIPSIGVFKAHSNDTAADKTLYVLVPLRNLDMVTTLPKNLEKDQLYQSAASAYTEASHDNPPYVRMETILLQAFPLAPTLVLPQLNGERKNRIYELRSYESATEKIFANKVQMFNEGDEIGLFKRLQFNASFYGEVIAGGKMPNLMYMTCHENKSARDINWKRFGESPEWKKLSSLPLYQNNVSHIDISFLYPTSYSDY